MFSFVITWWPCSHECGIALTGEGGLLTALTRQVLQSPLEAEVALHLGYDKHNPLPRTERSREDHTTRGSGGAESLDVKVSYSSRHE